MPETLLHVDLAAIAANYATLQAAAGGQELAGVLKADAYGLGAAAVAPVLWRAGCRTYFTAKLDEGMALRKILPEAAVYVLEGVATAEIAAFRANDLRPVLNQPGELELWAAAAGRAGQKLPAALQLETGLCRMGMAAVDLDVIRPAWLAAIDLTLVMSHLACADEPAHPQNVLQLERFAALAARLPKAPRSLANSSGIFLGPAFATDLARPGAALYGINPTPGKPNPMRPVVKLTAPVLRVLRLDGPGAVGYGATHPVAPGARIATIGIGYADGLPRAAGGAAKASIQGRTVPIIGRVSMDLTTLDVSGLDVGGLGEDAVGIGTPVELFGPDFDLDAVAAAAGTIGYEILTRLGARFRRVYTGQRAQERQDAA
jgi:alanine racemase